MGMDGIMTSWAHVDAPSHRWQEAQRAELVFWVRHREWILSGAFRTKIQARAKRIEDWIRRYFPIDSTTRILEIGGGAAGLVDQFELGIRYGYDPLASFYRREFGSVINPAVLLTGGRAEAMPYPNMCFDIVIICNVLDHCESPDRVLSELRRVLRASGLMYLAVNTYGAVMRLVKSLGPEVEHPYIYTHAGVARACRRAGFRVIDSRLDDPDEMWRFYPLSRRRLRTAVQWVLLQLGCLHYSEFLLRS